MVRIGPKIIPQIAQRESHTFLTWSNPPWHRSATSDGVLIQRHLADVLDLFRLRLSLSSSSSAFLSSWTINIAAVTVAILESLQSDSSESVIRIVAVIEIPFVPWTIQNRVPINADLPVGLAGIGRGVFFERSIKLELRVVG